jgi:hypothetical protein
MIRMNRARKEGPPICICHFAGENRGMEKSPGLAAMHAARLRKKWSRPYPHPPSPFRCQARSKQTGERCRQWARPKPDGSRYPTCWYHGSGGNRDHEKRGARLWRKRAEAYDAEQSADVGPVEQQFRDK